MSKIKNDLNNIKETMVENIDKILERGEKVELLVKKTAQMSAVATGIKKQVK